MQAFLNREQILRLVTLAAYESRLYMKLGAFQLAQTGYIEKSRLGIGGQKRRVVSKYPLVEKSRVVSYTDQMEIIRSYY
jgi:hypothetical protein